MWSPSEALQRQFQQSQRRLSSAGLSSTATATAGTAASPPPPPSPGGAVDDGGLHAVTASSGEGDEVVRSSVTGSTYTRRQAVLGAEGEEMVAASPGGGLRRRSHGGKGGGGTGGSAHRYWVPLICIKCRQEGHDSSRCPLNLPVCDMCGSQDHTDATTCPGRKVLLDAAANARCRGPATRAPTTAGELPPPREIIGARCSHVGDAVGPVDEFGERVGEYDCGPPGWTQRGPSGEEEEANHFCCNCGAPGHGKQKLLARTSRGHTECLGFSRACPFAVLREWCKRMRRFPHQDCVARTLDRTRAIA
jgi:hypothetical protein